MAGKGLLAGAILGAAAAALVVASKRTAEDLVKKGKRKIKDKVGEMFD